MRRDRAGEGWLARRGLHGQRPKLRAGGWGLAAAVAYGGAALPHCFVAALLAMTLLLPRRSGPPGPSCARDDSFFLEEAASGRLGLAMAECRAVDPFAYNRFGGEHAAVLGDLPALLLAARDRR